MSELENLENQAQEIKKRIEKLKKEKEEIHPSCTMHSNALFIEIAKLIIANPKEFFDYLERLEKVQKIDIKPILNVFLDAYEEMNPEAYREIMKGAKRFV